jgi:hypothetical protein
MSPGFQTLSTEMFLSASHSFLSSSFRIILFSLHQQTLFHILSFISFHFNSCNNAVTMPWNLARQLFSCCSLDTTPTLRVSELALSTIWTFSVKKINISSGCVVYMFYRLVDMPTATPSCWRSCLGTTANTRLVIVAYYKFVIAAYYITKEGQFSLGLKNCHTIMVWRYNILF